MDIEKLLKDIVEQVISMINKKVTLFISGGAVNLEYIFEILSSMKMLKYNIVMTDEAKNLISEKYINNLNCKIITCKVDMTKEIRESELILVPVMTRNTLAKCATGIQDNLVTVGIAECLMMNKEVVAIEDSFHPENEKNISLGFNKNSAYNRLILSHKDTLNQLGIKFINSLELTGTMNNKLINYNRSYGINYDNNMDGIVEKMEDNISHKEYLSGILTMEDIVVANKSKKIFIKSGAIITPMAKDYIYNNKIEIEYC